jgi:ribonuclease P protein component
VEKTGKRPTAGPKPFETIKKRADFIAAQSGERAGTPSFLLIQRAERDADCPFRVGFTVTKKLGSSTVRNRIRRRLREAARRVFPDLARLGTDYVLIARPAAETRQFALLLDDMKRALLRLNTLPK